MRSTDTHHRLLANWRLWADRLGMDEKFVQVLDAYELAVRHGREIPDGTDEAIAQVIQKARARVEATLPAEFEPGSRGHAELLDVIDDIGQVAKTVARKWGDVITEADLRQDIVQHFVERPKQLSDVHTKDRGDRKKILTWLAHQLAGTARTAYEHFSGQFTYSVDEVRDLLRRGALVTQLEGFDAQVADIRRGMADMEQRSPEYYEALVSRYVFDEAPTVRSLEAKRLERSVEALADRMNRNRNNERYEYRNGGQFRNNRSALTQVDLDYDGEDRFDGE